MKIEIGAQEQVAALYEKYGFKAVGQNFYFNWRRTLRSITQNVRQALVFVWQEWNWLDEVVNSLDSYHRLYWFFLYKIFTFDFLFTRYCYVRRFEIKISGSEELV